MLGRGRRDAPGRGLGWDPARAMELLTALSLGELALSFSRVPLFPVFDLSYFIVSILYLKYEPGEPGRAARRRKPWIMGRTVPETGSGSRQIMGLWVLLHPAGSGETRGRARREVLRDSGTGGGEADEGWKEGEERDSSEQGEQVLGRGQGEKVRGPGKGGSHELGQEALCLSEGAGGGRRGGHGQLSWLPAAVTSRLALGVRSGSGS